MHIPPPPKTFLKLEVRNGAGELTDVYEDRSRSWVRNAYNHMAHQFLDAPYSQTDGGSATYRAGSLRAAILGGNDGVNVAYPAANGKFSAGVNNSAKGIVVGTGTAAESLNNHSMGAIVNSGSAAGQLSYQASTVGGFAYDSVNRKWTATLTRIFNNNSGAPIVVKEIGLVSSDGLYMFLFSRDLLAEVDWKTVHNGGQLTVTYTIEMTFPA